MHCMKLLYHGGYCCGIKVLFGLGYDPKDDHASCEKPVRAHGFDDNADQFGYQTSSIVPFFGDELPKESGLDRLDRYIKYMEIRRPSNILEATLFTNKFHDDGFDEANQEWYDPDDPEDQRLWIPVLLSRGFKEVNAHMNSNSGNTVYVFHKNIGE